VDRRDDRLLIRARVGVGGRAQVRVAEHVLGDLQPGLLDQRLREREAEHVRSHAHPNPPGELTQLRLKVA
jgi:hypothetical protein